MKVSVLNSFRLIYVDFRISHIVILSVVMCLCNFLTDL